MSEPKATEGIDVRHRTSCATRTGGRCKCKPTYQAHVFDARTGRRIRKTFPTPTAAKLWRSDAITALRQGDRAAVTPTKRTVGQALDALVAGMEDGTILDRSGRRYRPATARSYRQASTTYLKSSLGHLRLSEVQRGDVQRVVDKLQTQGMSGSTIRNKLDPLRVVFRRALQDEEVGRNPTEKLRLPAMGTKPRGIGNVGRVDALLDALPVTERAAWATAFFAGLRVGELRALRWQHVDFEAGVIRVQAGWDDAEGEQDTKTTAGERTIPLVGRVRAELARHKLATGRTSENLVFGRSRSEAFVRSTLRSRALKAWKAVNDTLITAAEREGREVDPTELLTPLTPHEARHCCASYFSAAGLTPKEVQTALGHADIRTTLNIYAKAVPGWEEQATAKLDAYLAASVAP